MLTAVPRLTEFLYAVRRRSRDFKLRSVRSPPHPLVSKPTLTDPLCEAPMLSGCVMSAASSPRSQDEPGKLVSCATTTTVVFADSTDCSAPPLTREQTPPPFAHAQKNSNGWRCDRGRGGLVVKRLTVAQSRDAVWVVHPVFFFLKHPVGHRAEVGR